MYLFFICIVIFLYIFILDCIILIFLSLYIAFGAERTDLFKAAALRGLKTLFPPSYNPFSASFGIRVKDCIALSRCGVPEGVYTVIM